ncbi:MAG: STAS domain-containing protein, partial [Burkholderiales bacterium]|nr:STAS domain-containing protein [Burkholderiales bacterium]
MEAQFSLAGGEATIVLTGDFTFESHRAFKTASQQALTLPEVRSLAIDFKGVDYMDSAALGMLLLLRERFGDRPIILAHARGTVRAVIDVANFDRLFQLA